MDGKATHDDSKRPAFCALVVSYFPDERFIERLQRICAQCERVVVVDNGSPTESLEALRGLANLELILLGENIGLAAALNRGLARALEQGFAWAVTFDQDSAPAPHMVEELWRSREAYGRPEKVAVVGPRLSEERVVHEDHRWVRPHPLAGWLFERAACVSHDLDGVAFVITSGALMDLTAYAKIGPMDEALFIDYIDHDYCLRARAAGYEILVSARATLIHNLGAKREFTIAGKPIRPTFHSPLRLRYMARNRCRMWRRHALRFPYWAAFDIIFSHYNLLRVVLFEDARLRKIGAMARGTWDGILGRSGPIQS